MSHTINKEEEEVQNEDILSNFMINLRDQIIMSSTIILLDESYASLVIFSIDYH